MKQWKLLVIGSLLFTVIIWSVFFTRTNTESASWEDAYNRRRSEVQAKLNSVKSQVEGLNKNINELQKQQADLATQITTIRNQITQTETLINETRAEVARVEKDIESNTLEIDKLKQQIRYLFIDIQSNQVGSMLEILLTSKNIDQVLSKLNSLQTLQAQLSDVMARTQEKLKELNANKALLTETQRSLAETQAYQNSRKDQLSFLLEQTKGQQARYEELVAQLKKQQNAFEGEIATINAEQAAEAQRRSAEEARRRKEQGGTRSPGGIDPGGADYNACGVIDETVNISGLPDASYWTEPVAGFLTVGFGCQPSYLFYSHDAVDIANGTGTPVKSIAEGEVVLSRFVANGFGNYIIVKHTVPSGRRVYSLYAHLNQRFVEVGTRVGKGQQIATLGTTGLSTGPHTHFSIMDESYEITRVGTCNPRWASITSSCFNPFLAPFSFY